MDLNDLTPESLSKLSTDEIQALIMKSRMTRRNAARTPKVVKEAKATMPRVKTSDKETAMLQALLAMLQAKTKTEAQSQPPTTDEVK